MKIELSHDILAKKIYDKASDEDKMRRKIQRLLVDRMAYFNISKTLLSKDDLNYIEPFTGDMLLQKEEKDFITKSQQHIKRKSQIKIGLAIGAIILLIIFNGITRNAKKDLDFDIIQKENHKTRLEKEENLKIAAEIRADSLLKELEKKPGFTKQLLESYDTLQRASRVMETERNIAQSSTLSNLAASALEQNDPNFAFQLASKSWSLNKKNKQACQILYSIQKDGPYDPGVTTDIDTSIISHDEYILNLIATERSQNGRGELDEKDMKKIFNRQNKVVNEKKDGVREKIDNLVDKTVYKTRELIDDAKEVYDRIN